MLGCKQFSVNDPLSLSSHFFQLAHVWFINIQVSHDTNTVTECCKPKSNLSLQTQHVVVQKSTLRDSRDEGDSQEKKAVYKGFMENELHLTN